MCMCICAQMEGGACVCVGGGGGGRLTVYLHGLALFLLKVVCIYCWGGSEILSFYDSNQLCQHQEGLG